MSTSTTASASASVASQASPLVMRVIGACALAHLINDLIQAVLPSIYPMLKASYGLSFTQVGLITLTFQLTASLLQPWIGFYTCLLYTSPSPRDLSTSRMPSSA